MTETHLRYGSGKQYKFPCLTPIEFHSESSTDVTEVDCYPCIREAIRFAQGNAAFHRSKASVYDEEVNRAYERIYSLRNG